MNTSKQSPVLTLILVAAEGATIWTSFSPLRLATLAVCVLTNAALALGPFLLSDNLGNLLTRLFPFRRGLCHAYWAPNLWAVYNVVDKVSWLEVLQEPQY